MFQTRVKRTLTLCVGLLSRLQTLQKTSRAAALALALFVMAPNWGRKETRGRRQNKTLTDGGQTDAGHYLHQLLNFWIFIYLPFSPSTSHSFLSLYFCKNRHQNLKALLIFWHGVIAVQALSQSKMLEKQRNCFVYHHVKNQRFFVLTRLFGSSRACPRSRQTH